MDTKTQETTPKKNTLLNPVFIIASIFAGAALVLILSHLKDTIKPVGEAEIPRGHYEKIKNHLKENRECDEGWKLTAEAIRADSQISGKEFYKINKAFTACKHLKKEAWEHEGADMEIEEIRSLLLEKRP